MYLGGLTAVNRDEGETQARRHRLKFLRSRLIRYSFILAAAIGFTMLGIVVFFEIGPNPPGATTTISANIGSPGAPLWPTARRSVENNGYTPDQAPVPARVKWEYASPEGRSITATPAVVGDRIYVATEDGFAVALDQETGEEIWRRDILYPSDSTPAVVEDMVIVAVRPGVVTALNKDTGETVWSTPLNAPVFASPIVINGSVYIGAGDRMVYAIDVSTGEKRWEFEVSDWIVASVAYGAVEDKESVVVVSQDGVVNVIDTKTGLKRFVYDAGRPIQGGPAIYGDMAYVGNNGGSLWAFDRTAITYPFERAIWFWKINFAAWGILDRLPQQKGTVWGRNLRSEISGTPAVAHDTVFAHTSRGKVVAMEAATGRTRWENDLGTRLTAEPIVAGETLLVGAQDGTVLGLDTNTGETLWKFVPWQAAGHPLGDPDSPTWAQINGNPIVVGDTMYVVSNDGYLYAITGPE
jgi:outer membrane protein assembly factor BamB